MRAHESSRDAVAAELRARMTAFDRATVPPPELYERVTAPTGHGEPSSAPGRRRWSSLVLAATAVITLIVGLVVGIGWQRRQQSPQVADSTGVAMTVYNTERACQRLRTIECGLGVRRSPYQPLNTELPVARVWHGDVVVTDCVVLDGPRISDEDGVSSNRWYKIRTAKGVVGFLPAVRTHNTVEVKVCSAADAPR
jgi:hypothetical protein